MTPECRKFLERKVPGCVDKWIALGIDSTDYEFGVNGALKRGNLKAHAWRKTEEPWPKAASLGVDVLCGCYEYRYDVSAWIKLDHAPCWRLRLRPLY